MKKGKANQNIVTKKGKNYDRNYDRIDWSDNKSSEKSSEIDKKILLRGKEMNKLQPIQRKHNLNQVYRNGEAGPGGAYHDYKIEYSPDNNGYIRVHKIDFQKGPRQEKDSRHGILDEDLLEIVRDRLKSFQSGDFSCRENAIALTHIEEALLWMNERKMSRADRNVLGTYNK